VSTDSIHINPDVVNIFLCNKKLITDAVLLRKYETMLSVQEYARWQGLKSTKIKRRYLITRAMIRTLLSAALNCPLGDFELVVSDQGKPHLLHSDGWQFNLSHSHGVVVLAVTRHAQLGIDVEHKSRKMNALSIARGYFSETEIALLESLPENEVNEYFLSLWTLKESYLKAIGSGLSGSLKSCRFLLDHQRATITASVDAPLAKRFIDCWQCDYDGAYQLAITTLSDSNIPFTIQAYDFIPGQHCSNLDLGRLFYGRLEHSLRN